MIFLKLLRNLNFFSFKRKKVCQMFEVEQPTQKQSQQEHFPSQAFSFFVIFIKAVFLFRKIICN